MQYLRQKLSSSPESARVLPFAVFVIMTFGQGQFGPASIYWVYLLKSIVGAWLIWESRPFVQEMRWKLSWEAMIVGVVVCGLWVGLDGLYPRLAKPEVLWNPNKQFGAESGMSWFFNLTRLIASSLVVPPLEEVFYRSFLYRYFVRLNFLTMPQGQFHALSFIVTSAIFGLMHPDRWLAGILCGLAYQGLTIRKNRLGDAMTAHGVTNFLLGIWIIWRGDWSFW
jgi:CAAX prenyl protease-like protein